MRILDQMQLGSNYKTTPNKIDIVKIQKMYAEGKTTQEISVKLMIEQRGVEMFKPKPKAQVGTKPGPSGVKSGDVKRS